MRTLFDVNLLVALLDEEHVHHRRVHQWWATDQIDGWASCAITQNGFARVMSQPNYSHPISTAAALDLLARQIAGTDHVFWPEDISLLDLQLFERARILGPNQITDIYLLALAVKNDGRLATLDRSIPLSAVRGAEQRHMVVI